MGASDDGRHASTPQSSRDARQAPTGSVEGCEEANMMKSVCIAAVFAIGLALPAHADVTFKQTSEGKGLGLSGKTAGTTYIKGNKMRTDAVLGDKTQTTIFDIDAQKMYIFDSKKKEADVWDMAAFAQDVS
jgi:hypothetical protein